MQSLRYSIKTSMGEDSAYPGSGALATILSGMSSLAQGSINTTPFPFTDFCDTSIGSTHPFISFAPSSVWLPRSPAVGGRVCLVAARDVATLSNTALMLSTVAFALDSTIFTTQLLLADRWDAMADTSEARISEGERGRDRE